MARRKLQDLGEMQVSAETIDNKGKRHRITLDPLHSKDLAINAREVENTIPCGFQMDWGQGSYGKLQFKMAAGAGLGSRWMTFQIHDQGKDYSYCINADDIAKAVLGFHAEVHP